MTCESSVNKILLTGSSGFIATHLHKYLLECGHKVVPIDIQTRPSNPPHKDTLRIDVNDTESIKDIILRHEIDVIIHAAALTHVKYSWEQEFLYNTTNVQGTASILEAIRNSRRTPRYYITLSPLVYLSTDEVYGDSPQIKDDSDIHQLSPTNPYAQSKLIGENLIAEYRQKLALDAIIIRSNNVYGPMQFPDKVIPRFICRTLKGLPCQIEGDGTHTRRYIYVQDAVRAIALIMSKGKAGRVYNVSTENEISNVELAKLIIKLIRPGEPIRISWIKDRIYNDKQYCTTCSNTSALGWKVAIDWQAGLSATIAWYQTHTEGWWADLGDLYDN